jgi:hypothetical protein
MNKKLSIIIIGAFSILSLSFLLPNSQCDLFKKGRFHFYPKDSKSHYLIIREDSLQSEINLKTGDTSFWKIKWLSGCEFNCSYISGIKSKSTAQQDFFNKSNLTVSIVYTSKDFYVYDGIFQSGLFTKQFNDTMWLNEK